MPNFAYINNKFVNFKSAKIHIEDRGLQFADSVYEVIAVLDNNLIDLDFHLNRLKYSLRELEIKFTINKKNLTNIFLNLIKKNNLKAGISIKPKTEAKEIIPYLELIDLILVMTVEPGFGGQKFLSNQLKKIMRSREIVVKELEE